MDSITETTNIYVLRDPRNNKIRYVGKANDTSVRLRNHVKEARQGKTDHKANWLRQVLSEGFYPVLEVIEVCSVYEWQEREFYWIEEMKRRGCYLTNEKDGGYGCNPSAETREKMSAAKRGKPSNTKGKETPEHVRAKQSISAITRWASMTKEQIKQYIAPMLAAKKPVTEETREKFRNIAKNRFLSKERINKSTLNNYELSREQVLDIRSMLSNGVTQKDIAKKHNISITVVSNIKNGKSYKLYE